MGYRISFSHDSAIVIDGKLCGYDAKYRALLSRTAKICMYLKTELGSIF